MCIFQGNHPLEINGNKDVVFKNKRKQKKTKKKQQERKQEQEILRKKRTRRRLKIEDTQQFKVLHQVSNI